jgi:hypothetical protein
VRFTPPRCRYHLLGVTYCPGPAVPTERPEHLLPLVLPEAVNLLSDLAERVDDMDTHSLRCSGQSSMARLGKTSRTLTPVAA